MYFRIVKFAQGKWLFWNIWQRTYIHFLMLFAALQAVLISDDMYTIHDTDRTQRVQAELIVMFVYLRHLCGVGALLQHACDR